MNCSRSVSAWLMAIRPKTLPIGAAPVLLGSAVAFADGFFSMLPALAALTCALLMQITSNFINDLYDYRKGADTPERLGPPRAVASGLLSERAVKRAAWISAALAFVIGQYLVWVGGWPILVIGMVSLIAAWAYTGGPKPLAYLGLGEVCAFMFFGVVSVCGTYFVQAGAWSVKALFFSVIPGIFSANILMTNNIRDITTDTRAGKYTLPVRVGARVARMLYVALTAFAVAIPIGMWLAGWSVWLLLALGAVPFGVAACRALNAATGTAFNTVLLHTIRLLAVDTLLLSAALCLSRLHL